MPKDEPEGGLLIGEELEKGAPCTCTAAKTAVRHAALIWFNILTRECKVYVCMVLHVGNNLNLKIRNKGVEERMSQQSSVHLKLKRCGYAEADTLEA
jgi:hypothetical protein